MSEQVDVQVERDIIVSGLFFNLIPTYIFHCYTWNCGGPGHASSDTSYPTDCLNSATWTIKTILEHYVELA
jgi:hypothetical protein